MDRYRAASAHTSGGATSWGGLPLTGLPLPCPLPSPFPLPLPLPLRNGRSTCRYRGSATWPGRSRRALPTCTSACDISRALKE
eukprot:3871390-Amphidinium_carterae.2